MLCFSEDAGPGEALLPLHESVLTQKSSLLLPPILQSLLCWAGYVWSHFRSGTR